MLRSNSSILESTGVTALPRPRYYSVLSHGEHFKCRKSREEDEGRRQEGSTTVSHTAFHRISFEPGNFMSAKY